MHAAWLIALMSIGWGADKPATALPSCVRPVRAAERILRAAAARSPTIRDLLVRLDASDVIVYIEITPTPDVPVARTKFVTATPLARFLRIGINAGVPLIDWPPLLAHELQHAAEIAEHVDVRDDAGVRRLYRGIGHQYGTDNYETDAAIRVERKVRNELQRR
jgi:hypothetical protein